MDSFNLISRPTERYQPFPLSDLQLAYYVGRSGDFAIGNVGSHAYHEYEIDGLEADRLQQAWHEVVARHDGLRTVFTADLQQQVLEGVSAPPIACNDLRDVAEAELESRLDLSRSRMANFVFDPHRWPLFRLELSLLPDERCILHLAIDLLIVDAASMGVVKRNLIAAYMKPGSLADKPVTLTFRDYMLALKEYENGAEFAEAQAYWRERLDTLPMPPEIPYKMPREAEWTPTFRRTLGSLPRGAWQLLKQRANSIGVTATVVLLAAFGQTLARFSGSPRFLLNLTLNSRPPVHDEINEVVGDFTSVVLLEIDLSEPQDFASLCRTLQNRLWSDLQYNVAGGLHVIRELSRRQKNPFIVPVVFTSTLSNNLALKNGEDISVRRLRRSGQTPQVLLDHLMNEENGELQYGWNVVEEVFPPGLKDAMWESHVDLLGRIADPVHDWNQSIPVRLPLDQQQQRRLVNDTAQQFDWCTLDTLFLRQAARTPDQVAVIDHEMQLSYAELESISAAVAEQLLARQTSPGQLVAVMMHKGWHQVAAVLGILRAGAAYLPLDPDAPPARQAHLLQHAEVAVVLTQAGLQATAASLPVAQVIAIDATMRPAAPHAKVHSTDLNALAYVLYTSGSTGVPKGVMIDHRGACNTVLDINARFGVTAKDRLFALSSLGFDLSVYDIFGALACGAAIVMPGSAQQHDSSSWLALVRQHQVSIWNSVPMLLKLFATDCLEQQVRLPHLRLALCSGDWVPLDLFESCRALNPGLTFVSLGGATEASIWSIFRTIDQVPANWTSIPYGKPLANQTMHVLNAQLQPCATLVSGEIFIGGIGVALGYWRDPARSEAAFILDPHSGQRLYRTGDLGRYLPDGDIEFLGRRDHQVKLRGFRIELGEIEAALMAQPGISQAAAAIHGNGPEARLVAYAVASEAQQLDCTAVRQGLQQILPAYMLPSVVMQLDSLPLTPNGKLNRTALPQPTGERDHSNDWISPQEGLESDLAHIWEDVLQVKRVGANDNFFDLGGHSILATRLISRIRHSFNVDLPLRSVFEAPTLANVARQIHAIMHATPTGIDHLATAPADDEAFEVFSISSEDEEDFMA